MFLKQATGSQSRIIGPFVDDTDFKTAETGLTIANTDIKLMANGAASVNKNSGGGTHRANGCYGVTFDATDTATVGELEVSVVVSGALPVFHKFFVLEEAVYDALFGASAVGYVADQPVNATKLGGTTQTGADVGSLVAKFTGMTSLPQWLGALAGKQTPNSTAQTEIRATGAGSGTYDATTDSQEATRDNMGTAQSGDSYARLGAPAGASVSADIAALKSDTAAILVDTGTTLDAKIDAIDDYVDTEIAAIKAVTDKLDDTLEDAGGGNYIFTEAALAQAPAAAGGLTVQDIVDGVWDEPQSAHTDSGSFGEYLDSAVSGVSTGGVSAGDIADAVLDEAMAGHTTSGTLGKAIADILADTAEIGAAGAGLSNIPWNASWDAEVQSEAADALAAYDPPTYTEMIAGFAGQNDISPSEVNAEVVDVFSTDTHAEPGQGSPGATISYGAKINYLYKWARNKKDNDGTKNQFYADDGTTVDQIQSTSVAGGVVTVGEMTTGA